jgi:hypothetical protein
LEDKKGVVAITFVGERVVHVEGRSRLFASRLSASEFATGLGGEPETAKTRSRIQEGRRPMKRPMPWLCLLLVAALLGYAWMACTTRPRMPEVGMSEKEVEEMLGPESGRLESAKLWDMDTGAIFVNLDDQRRVCEVIIMGRPRGPNLWVRFRGWFGF